MVPSSRETGRDQRSHPNPNKRRPNKLICRILIRFLWTQILVMVNLVCTFLKIMRQLSKWSSKGEELPWDMFLGHTELRWIRCSTESIQIQRSKSNRYVDTENQMGDMLTKGSFTRDEWNHLLHLFNIVNLSTFFSQPLLFFQTESRAVWCRKDPKKVFWMIHHRWRQRPRAMNLVSHRNLSILRQSSQNTMTAAIHLNVQKLRIQWYSKFVQCHWNVDNG